MNAIMARLIARLRVLLGYPIPDPIPDPVDVPEPVYVDLWPNTLHLFCEASDATKYDKAGLHGNVIVHAIRGRSMKTRTVRCIHPWYDPYKKSPTQGQLDGWFREAKTSGCIGMSVDWEGWIKDRVETERIVAMAEQFNMPLVLVPKWTLDPSGELYCGCKTQAEVVAILNTWRVPALLLWLYMGNAEWRRATLKSIFRDNGYVGQLIGMTDGGMREGDTDRQGNKYNTVAETWEFMRLQKQDGRAVGLFNVPTDHRSLKYALDLYK